VVQLDDGFGIEALKMKLVIVNKRFGFGIKDLSPESKSLLGFIPRKHNRIPHTEIIRSQVICSCTT
jgi:hypothetical protein